MEDVKNGDWRKLRGIHGVWAFTYFVKVRISKDDAEDPGER